jgi:hypothetical protein
MFEQLIAEDMKLNTRNTYREDDCIDAYMKPIQFRPSLIDRVLTTLGDALIRFGLKLKYRPSASLTSKQAHAPNFLIML